MLGAAHPDTLIAKFNYANTIKNLEKFEAAEKIYKEVVQKSDEVLGIGHPINLNARANWAGNLGAQHKYEEAEEKYMEVV